MCVLGVSEEGLEDGFAFLDVEHQQVRVAVVEEHLQRHRTKQVPPTQDLFVTPHADVDDDKLTDDDGDGKSGQTWATSLWDHLTM